MVDLDGWVTTSASWSLKIHKFTGKERDPESGLDNFGARYYSSQFGRFMIPDWSAFPDTVPYANFTDPQSLNLYAYVRNNPISLVDVDGHDGDGCDWSDNTTDCNIVWQVNVWGQQPSFWGSIWGSIKKIATSCPDDECGDFDSALPQGMSTLLQPLTSQPQTPGSPQRQQTPWYNTCTAKALGNGLLHAGIDSIGLIPEGSFVSRAVGNAFDYRGIVADQFGNKVLGAVQAATGISSTGLAANNRSSSTGSISAVLGGAGIAAALFDATPVARAFAGASVVLDAIQAGIDVSKCY